MPHLLVVPILLPMLAAGVMLAFGEGHRDIKSRISLVVTSANIVVALALAVWVHAHGPVAYLMGNWPAPFGIVLVVDRLSAVMVLLAAVVALCAVLFSSARWDKAGVHYYPLAMLLLMGLSGAFLTGDLFNLYVYFEILLAASYGLLLHGSGRQRVSASVHYVAVNLAASSLFLIGATTIYGVTGTLNMADLVQRVVEVPAADRWLLHVGAGVLSVAFLAKAAAWPLNFWLVPAYSSATAPVAAYFAIMTKVGFYSVIRMASLIYAESPEQFGRAGLFALGVVTAILGALGMVGTLKLARLASYGVMVSSGTLIAAFGLQHWEITGGAIFYLVSSVLGACALYLLIDLIERWQNLGATLEDDAPFLAASFADDQNVNLDDDEERLIGRSFPASTAFLALAFLVCTLMIAGLPPLSSFVGKVAMLSASLTLGGNAADDAGKIWVFMAVLLGTGLLSLIALTRAGIRTFWATPLREGPRLRLAEGLPVGLLLLTALAITAAANPILEYVNGAAKSLYYPGAYVESVMRAPIVPPPGAKETP